MNSTPPLKFYKNHFPQSPLPTIGASTPMQLDWHRSFPSGFPRAQGRLSDSQPACQWVELWVGGESGLVLWGAACQRLTKSAVAWLWRLVCRGGLVGSNHRVPIQRAFWSRTIARGKKNTILARVCRLWVQWVVVVVVGRKTRGKFAGQRAQKIEPIWWGFFFAGVAPLLPPKSPMEWLTTGRKFDAVITVDWIGANYLNGGGGMLPPCLLATNILGAA